MFGGCTAMGILRAMGICRRVKEMQEFARVLSFLTGELRYHRDILAQVFTRVSRKCKAPYADWLSTLAVSLRNVQDVPPMQEREVVADFYQIWVKNADELYEKSGLKKEDIEYIYNLGQTIGYLDVQAQEEGLALLQADLSRHIHELETTSKEQMKIAFVIGTVVGVLLIIILI